jgi:hypothetical protein
MNLSRPLRDEYGSAAPHRAVSHPPSPDTLLRDGEYLGTTMKRQTTVGWAKVLGTTAVIRDSRARRAHAVGLLGRDGPRGHGAIARVVTRAAVPCPFAYPTGAIGGDP